MAKTKDELLKPRYKVIADYPKSLYHVGDIINAGGTGEDCIYCDREGPRLRDYPHLFKKLEWWEDREVSDMPEYVKDTQGAIAQVKWKEGAITENGQQPMIMFINEGYGSYAVIEKIMCFFEPATLEDYNLFTKQNK